MALAWNTIERFPTAEGTVELRQRGERDFLITIGPQILMNSSAHRSEAALGRLACGHLGSHPRPRVLVAGLGMGYTLRSVLDTLPGDAVVLVAELNPVIVQWCRGPLAALTDSAVGDPRVSIQIRDVSEVIRASAIESGAEGFDAIVLDLYTGPDAGCDERRDPLYGSAAISRSCAALKPGGVLGVWGEKPDAGYCQRLQTAGFAVTTERPGRGGLRHVVYVAQRKTGRGSR